MIKLNPTSNTATTTERRPSQAGRGTARGPSVETIYKAVIASYIHEISARHRDGVAADHNDPTNNEVFARPRLQTPADARSG